MSADSDLPVSAATDLARVFAPFHNLVYFMDENKLFTDAGIRGWWMAYFAYRSAPLGVVPAEVVAAIFYNFAHRMIARAIPSAWEVMSAERAIELRLEVVDRAVRRLIGDAIASPEMAEAADLARRSIEGQDFAGRPLYAAHAALPWPSEPHLALWHACTLLREHRFDGHNVALLAGGLDGVESHVAMVARGHGNRASILPIRGWTEEEWAAAERRLIDRGWLNPDGSFTPAGSAGRDAIEAETNRLALGPARVLGTAGIRRLSDLIGPFLKILHEQGGLPGSWPPPHLIRPDRG